MDRANVDVAGVIDGERPRDPDQRPERDATPRGAVELQHRGARAAYDATFVLDDGPERPLPPTFIGAASAADQRAALLRGALDRRGHRGGGDVWANAAADIDRTPAMRHASRFMRLAPRGDAASAAAQGAVGVLARRPSLNGCQSAAILQQLGHDSASH